jgi:6-hydroxytryprostatin B O-methyltransferase
MKIPPTIIAQVDSTTDKVPETAFNLAYNTEENLFQYFAHSKDLNKKYHEYLMGRVNTPLWSMDRLRAAWNWSYLGQNTIVDVRCSPTVDLLNCWVDSSLDRLVDHPATQS